MACSAISVRPSDRRLCDISEGEQQVRSTQSALKMAAGALSSSVKTAITPHRKRFTTNDDTYILKRVIPRKLYDLSLL